MSLHIDSKDKEILYFLDINARQSFKSLGKKAKINKNTLQYRISRMEKGGVIKRYYALIDAAKLGYLVFRVFLRLKNITIEREEEIIKYLILHPGVGWVVSVEGNWDINFMIWAESHFEFEAFWREFSFLFSRYIHKKWISLFVRLHFYSKAYLAGLKKDEEKPLVLYEKPKRRITWDEKDKMILNMLAEDGRVSTVEIARKIGISPNAVKSRIKRMERDGIIKAYKPMIDLEKIGYRYYKLHASLKNAGSAEWSHIRRFCHRHPNILDLNELINGADFEIDVQVKDDIELRRFISEIRAHLKDYIIDYEILHYYREHKFVFFPKG